MIKLSRVLLAFSLIASCLQSCTNGGESAYDQRLKDPFRIDEVLAEDGTRIPVSSPMRATFGKTYAIVYTRVTDKELSKLELEAFELSDVFVVREVLPPNAVGGGVTLILDKQSLEVLSGFATQ